MVKHRRGSLILEVLSEDVANKITTPAARYTTIPLRDENSSITSLRNVDNLVIEIMVWFTTL
jgi:hypothetical protein